jgi:flagellar basal body-associated protein FliL
MSKNLFIVIMVTILTISVAIGGYLYTQSNKSTEVTTITDNTKVENEVKMDDIYVDKNEKVVKPMAEKDSSNLDETQIENQMNELDNAGLEEINTDELN